MYTSDLSDVEDKKTKTNNHKNQKKRKDISLSKNTFEQLSKQTFYYTIQYLYIPNEVFLVLKWNLYLSETNDKLNLKLSIIINNKVNKLYTKLMYVQLQSPFILD